MIKNLIFGVYLLILYFLVVSKSKKTSKKNDLFYNTVSLKKPHANRKLVGVRKSICIAPFLHVKELHILGALGKQISVYSCISSFENFCSRDLESFLEIQIFFRISILPSIVLKRCHFPSSLEFKGSVVAKFL